MSDDESRPSSSRRPRAVEKKALPAGPVKDLRDAVYRLYAEADRPQLAELAQQIADDNDLPGSPGKDLIGKIISGDGPAGQHDTVGVAVVLARLAGHGDVARIAEQVRRSWVAAATAEPVLPVDRLGHPVGACDPLLLEVHRAIQVPDTGTSADPLPGYVPRAHDAVLHEVADRLLGGGSSRLVTLVGGSSTGKTRACWELARYLDQRQRGRWRLWHPYDPTRPEATLADLNQVGPHTIVWLNEAQFYLAPPDAELGERVAAGLRTLLHDPRRAPMLVLATLWPQHWDALTVRPGARDPDRYPQARDLLTGTRVSVADRFTPNELAGLRHTSVDPRIRQAVSHAEDARITQYLAGAPELEDRYRTAPSATRAIIQVAIDARRLGHPPALSHVLLEQAAPGYIDDHDWDSLDEDWLEQALAYTARGCKGARGPLTRIRPRPGQSAAVGGQPCYRLADYLEQTGRHERVAVYPPESLWTTFAATVADPNLLRNLGGQAEARGRYQHAIWLYTLSVDRGDNTALENLAQMRERAGDAAGAEAVALLAADRGDNTALENLAQMREWAGDTAGAETLYQQAADRGDTTALKNLAQMREWAGDTAGAETLYQQAADRGDTAALWKLAHMREWAGDSDGAETRYQQAADRSDTEELITRALRTGNTAEAEALYRQAIDRGAHAAQFSGRDAGAGRGHCRRRGLIPAGRRPRQHRRTIVPGRDAGAGRGHCRRRGLVSAGRRPWPHPRAGGDGTDARASGGQRWRRGCGSAGRRPRRQTHRVGKSG